MGPPRPTPERRAKNARHLRASGFVSPRAVSPSRADVLNLPVDVSSPRRSQPRVTLAGAVRSLKQMSFRASSKPRLALVRAQGRHAKSRARGQVIVRDAVHALELANGHTRVASHRREALAFADDDERGTRRGRGTVTAPQTKTNETRGAAEREVGERGRRVGDDGDDGTSDAVRERRRWKTPDADDARGGVVEGFVFGGGAVGGAVGAFSRVSTSLGGSSSRGGSHRRGVGPSRDGARCRDGWWRTGLGR